MQSIELNLQHESRDCVFTTEMAPESDTLPSNPVLGYYLANLLVRPGIVAIGSLLLVNGWIAVLSFEPIWRCGPTNDMILSSEFG